MSNIFKSKEVYKHVTKPGDVHELIPVRGMFVANQHRSPFYVDHTLEIINVGNVPAEVITYIEVDETVYGPPTDFTPSISVTNSLPTVVDYYTNSIDVYLPAQLGATLTTTNSTITIYEYTQSSYTVNNKIVVTDWSVSGTHGTVVVTDVLKTKETEIDGFLQITDFSAPEATIT